VISGVGEGSIPDRWHSKCKVAEVTACYICSRSARKGGRKWQEIRSEMYILLLHRVNQIIYGILNWS
jgi:hypothetical protein